MPTTLVAGDIAFSAVQADNSPGGDTFQFVLLRDVLAGTTIFFTDSGYLTTTNAFRTNENTVRWVAQADVVAGTKISLVVTNGNAIPSTAEFTFINPTTGAALASGQFGLSTAGDNITAFTNPTFGGTDAQNGTAIAAINFGATTFATTFSNTGGNSNTALAPGLTVGQNAVAVGNFDNAVYNPAAAGSVESGTAAQVRASLNTAANFTASEEPVGLTTATFAPLNFIEGNTNAGQTLTGTNGGDYILAKAGNDIVNALGGNDRAYGLGGNDIISLGAGTDLGYGGAGNDTLDYSGSAGAVFIDMAANSARETALTTGTVQSATAVQTTDFFYEFENLIGSGFGDRLYGDGNDNVFTPGAGNDLVYGGGGVNTVSYANATGAVFASIATGQNFVNETALTTGTVSAGTPLVSIDYIFNIQNLTGSAFGDRLYGTASGNTLDGGDGDDIIYGLDGTDILLGGSGNDFLLAGLGTDTSTGGLGNDRFYFTATDEGLDTITDFSSTDDDLYFRSAAFDSSATLQTSGSGTAAGAAFFYDQASGLLTYSATGVEAASVQIAELADGTLLTVADIVFYA